MLHTAFTPMGLLATFDSPNGKLSYMLCSTRLNVLCIPVSSIHSRSTLRFLTPGASIPPNRGTCRTLDLHSCKVLLLRFVIFLKIFRKVSRVVCYFFTVTLHWPYIPTYQQPKCSLAITLMNCGTNEHTGNV